MPETAGNDVSSTGIACVRECVYLCVCVFGVFVLLLLGNMSGVFLVFICGLCSTAEDHEVWLDTGLC